MRKQDAINFFCLPLTRLWIELMFFLVNKAMLSSAFYSVGVGHLEGQFIHKRF